MLSDMLEASRLSSHATPRASSNQHQDAHFGAMDMGARSPSNMSSNTEDTISDSSAKEHDLTQTNEIGVVSAAGVTTLVINVDWVDPSLLNRQGQSKPSAAAATPTSPTPCPANSFMLTAGASPIAHNNQYQPLVIGQPIPVTPMTPWAVPMPMQHCSQFNKNYESQQEVHCQMVKPRTAKGKAARQVNSAKKPNHQNPNKGDVTTLMIRGIPCSFSQETVMSLIDEANLQGKYNFFYLPFDANGRANLGYAFVNFVDRQSAELCEAAFDGVRLSPMRSPKTCRTSPADIQGLPSLYRHFRRATMNPGEHAPLFLNV